MCGGTSKCIIVLYLTVAMLSTANMGVWVGNSKCGCMGGHFEVRNVFAFDGCNAQHCKYGCVGGHFQLWVYGWGHFQVRNVLAFDGCNAQHCKYGCVGGHFQMWVYRWALPSAECFCI